MSSYACAAITYFLYSASDLNSGRPLHTIAVIMTLIQTHTYFIYSIVNIPTKFCHGLRCPLTSFEGFQKGVEIHCGRLNLMFRYNLHHSLSDGILVRYPILQMN